jgi:single-stranded-DNA-specific exonuclease
MRKTIEKFAWDENGAQDPVLVRNLARSFDIPAAAARFLASRSFTIEAAREYLGLDECRPHDPFLFDNMPRAIERVRTAIAEKKAILIHGDYDVDGICGAALLYRYFRNLVPDVYRFVPDRRKDGYGISERAYQWAMKNGVGLFLGVDCGTSDGELVGRLEAAGVDVIICDHHEFPVDREAKGIILNPIRKGERYPFDGLCGTGVAYKLIQSLESSGVTGAVKSESLVDLVALATVGDVAPLVGENRCFVREGLVALNASMRPGIAALAAAAGLDRPEIGAFHIGYILAPRLNAPGRLSTPKPALELLCEDDPARAAALADALESENEDRKSLTERVKADVMARILAMPDRRERGGFVLAGKNWNEGVLGIAASRVVDEYGRPAVLISLGGESGKGSGRSVPGVHLKDLLDKCSEHLLRYGGHGQAVGFSIDPGKVDAFARDLTRLMTEAASSLPAKPRLRIDADLALPECSLDLVDFLSRCEPFGQGNRPPVWAVREVVVSPETRYVGKKHLKLYLRDRDGMEAEGISFNWDQRETPPESLHGLVVDLAVSVKKGYYLERYYPEIQVLDLRASGG